MASGDFCSFTGAKVAVTSITFVKTLWSFYDSLACRRLACADSRPTVFLFEFYRFRLWALEAGGVADRSRSGLEPLRIPAFLAVSPHFYLTNFRRMLLSKSLLPWSSLMARSFALIDLLICASKGCSTAWACSLIDRRASNGTIPSPPLSPSSSP